MPMDPSDASVAEAVRRACIEAALAAYEDAKIRGLCHEGAWECAVEALRSLDLRTLPGGSPAPEGPPPGAAPKPR
jgi:hypothetical protein